MAEITLADYTGYIFLEIIKARQMADQYSKGVADAYAKDPIMKHFSVPRFKVPKMELTIPVLISGARFSQVIRFKMDENQFVGFILGWVDDVVDAVKKNADGEIVKLPPPTRSARVTRAQAAELDGPVRSFYTAIANGSPSDYANIVAKWWERIFMFALKLNEIIDLYRKSFPNNELLRKTTSDILATVTANTVVDKTTMESLLINPETNVVKSGSSDTSVFTIKAEMLEEGFFIRSVKDEDGTERKIVEFE